jgi:predicted neutral ceramidase superfamily lipid hydrolase
MKPLVWMIAVSFVSWAAIALLAARGVALDIFLGMLGPLVAVCGTWILAVVVHRRTPESVLPLMVMGFTAKLVFFGAYVAVMLRVVKLQPVPFAVSFTSYFIALYLIEALCLQRLFRGGMRASR